MGEAEVIQQVRGSPIPLELTEAFIRRITDLITPYCTRSMVVGSVRRRIHVVHDIDFLLMPKTQEDKQAIYAALSSITHTTLSAGDQRMIFLIACKNDKFVQVDISFCDDPAEWGAQMIHTTGSVGYNIRLRKVALRKGMKLSQHGVFRDGERIAGKSEEEVLHALGCRYRNPVGEREEG